MVMVVLPPERLNHLLGRFRNVLSKPQVENFRTMISIFPFFINLFWTLFRTPIPAKPLPELLHALWNFYGKINFLFNILVVYTLIELQAFADDC